MNKLKKIILNVRKNKKNNQLQTYLPKEIRDAIKKEQQEACKFLFEGKWRVVK